jgi:hypothetical protein
VERIWNSSQKVNRLNQDFNMMNKMNRILNAVRHSRSVETQIYTAGRIPIGMQPIAVKYISTERCKPDGLQKNNPENY